LPENAPLGEVDSLVDEKGLLPLNLAIVRYKVFNILKSEKSTLSLKRKRLKLQFKPALMAALLAC
jgi:hypothetical protein